MAASVPSFPFEGPSNFLALVAALEEASAGSELQLSILSRDDVGSLRARDGLKGPGTGGGAASSLMGRSTRTVPKQP